MSKRHIEPIHTIGDVYKKYIIFKFYRLMIFKEVFKVEDKRAIRYKIIFK